MSTTLILLIVIGIAIIWIITTINGFRSKEIKVTEGLSGIEVALTKRYDLLTKLYDATKGFMEHEKEVFNEVTKLRQNMKQNMQVNEMKMAEKEIENIFSKLFAVAEDYPELRSSDVFIELQHGISDAEEHLQAARRLYNANVTAYNTAIVMFPASLLASGRTAKEFFEAESIKRQDVAMNF